MSFNRTTVGDAKAFGIANAIGIISEDPRFIRYLNEAIVRLAYKGPWVGSIQRMRICIDGMCIVCPRDVINLDGVIAGCERVNIRNMWYEYLGPEINPGCACNCGIDLINRSFSPFPKQFQGPDTICVYSDQCDAGKTVLIQGLDQNGKPVRNQYPSGSGKWENGERITLNAPVSGSETPPYACSLTQWTKLTGIQKDETTHSIQLFRGADVSDPTLMFAEYGPAETAPQYLRYELCGNICGSCEPCGNACDPNPCPVTSITVLARLGPTPVKADSDYLLIQNLPALKDMMMAILYAEQNDPQRAAMYEVRAIDQLKAEKRAHSPQHQASAEIHVTGTAPFSAVMAGFI